MFDFFKNIGVVELVIIASILLLLFGGKKMKELSRGLGESSKELKKVKHEFETVNQSEPKSKKEES